VFAESGTIGQHVRLLPKGTQLEVALVDGTCAGAAFDTPQVLVAGQRQ